MGDKIKPWHQRKPKHRDNDSPKNRGRNNTHDRKQNRERFQSDWTLPDNSEDNSRPRR